MKKLMVVLPILIFLTVALYQAGAMTISGGQIGVVTAAQTPIPCGTGSPAVVILNGAVLNADAPNPSTLYLNMCIYGGTAGTDGAYCVPAPLASPAASPSPAPSASSHWGYPFPSGGTFPLCSPFNFPTAGGGGIISSRWDCSCTTSLSIIPVTLP